MVSRSHWHKEANSLLSCLHSICRLLYLIDRDSYFFCPVVTNTHTVFTPKLTMSDIRVFFLVACFGSVGAVSRYSISLLTTNWFGQHFAIGTLVVNIIGCFCLGLLGEIGEHLVPVELRTALAAGLLGALTTFSTFGHETFRYLDKGDWWLAAANVSANLVLGLFAVWLGMQLANWSFA